MKYNLSEITEVIKNRRTIFPEQYSERKVHRELVENILNNARWAPTHGMTQPWRFKVFMDKGLEKLSSFQSEHYRELNTGDQFNEKKYEKLRERPLMASVVVAICMERQASEKIPEIEEVSAVACAVQNMHLTCTAYGLGGFWSTGGVLYTDGMRDFLGLGKKDKCLGLFYMGYPEDIWPKGQRKPLEYLTEWISE